MLSELHIAIEFDRIQRQFDLLHVPPVQRVLDLRVGQKNVADAHAQLRLRDVLDLLLRLLPITRLAFGELRHEPAEQFERLRIIRLDPPVAVRQRDGPTLAHHPLGIVVERVVIPISRLAGFERALEFLGHAGAPLPIPALIADRHGDEIMRVRLVVFGLRDFQHVVQHVEGNVIAPRAVLVLTLRPGRSGHAPDQREIAFAGEFEVACAGPPIQRRLIIRPRGTPILLIAPGPVEIAERLLDFHPDAILLLLALHIADEFFQLLARLIQLGGVGGLRGGL